MARIAIDMDEVIADALGHHLHLYNQTFGKKVEREQVSGHLLDFVDQEHRQTMLDLIDHDFFASLKVMEGAQEVIRELTKSYDVFIATAAMDVPQSLAAKYDWLQEHFPFLSPMNYVFCGDKSIVAADFLIDDQPRHFRKFRGTGILFDASHNRSVTGYTRVTNWFEVDTLFRSDFPARSMSVKQLQKAV